jgi:hypothetical protein
MFNVHHVSVVGLDERRLNKMLCGRALSARVQLAPPLLVAVVGNELQEREGLIVGLHAQVELPRQPRLAVHDVEAHVEFESKI